MRVVAEILRRGGGGGALNGLTVIVRRLVIIMVEDALVHPALPLVVWVMLALTRGYVPSEMLLQALFQVIWEVAHVHVYDDPATDTGDGCPLTQDTGATVCAHPNDALVRSLLVRVEYGGMKGDMSLLCRSARTWGTRLRNNTRWSVWLWDVHYRADGPHDGCLPHEWLRHVPLAVGDVPIAAIDFHCTDIVRRVINRIGTPHLQRVTHRVHALGIGEVVRKAVWLHRSSVNYRTPLYEDMMARPGPPLKRQKQSTAGGIVANVWACIESDMTLVSTHMRSRYFGPGAARAQGGVGGFDDYSARTTPNPISLPLATSCGT
jgi:hypothetical protein